jgi:predicted nucleotidyltransferase
MDPALFHELCQLASATAARFPSVALVLLFGSVARDQARGDSDADIGVLGGDFWQKLELGSVLASRLGREPHVVELERAPEALAYEVARTAIVLFERVPGIWPRYQGGAATRFFDFQPAHRRFVEGARRRLIRELQSRQGVERG